MGNHVSNFETISYLLHPYAILNHERSIWRFESMNRVAVLLAPGFEESEALTIADVLRRADIEAELVGVAAQDVTGSHAITVRADRPVDDLSAVAWDMIVIPGGYTGVAELIKNEDVLSIVREMDASGKLIAAICAGPRVLDAAGVLRNRKYTCYPGQEKLIASGRYEEALVLRDENLITSIGPACCYAFSYALIDALGGDSMAVKNRMVYFNAFDESESRRYECPESVKQPESPKKTAVLMKPGFEEGETFSIVDILRRTGMICTTFCFEEDPFVIGMHGMRIKADRVFPGDIEDYDVVVLPGGRPGGQNLKEDPRVIELLQRWNDNPEKILSALCSGTTVLAAAKVIEGKRMTGYTGYQEKLPGAVFEETVAVSDQNLVTSQGPATGYPFAFKLAETLGYDTRIVRSRLMYDYAGGFNA